MNLKTPAGIVQRVWISILNALQSLRPTYWKGREALSQAPRRFMRSASCWSTTASDYIEQLRVLYHFIRTTHQPKAFTAAKAHGRRMLFVTYFSPPYTSAMGTQRLTKFTKYWTRDGWNITLLTTAPRAGDPVDSQGETIHPDVRVVRTEPAMPKSRLVHQGRFVPDDYFRWVRPAVEALDKLIRTERPDVIVATVPPYSNAIAAAICAARHGIPLVTDFRDPWTQIDVVFVIRRKLLRWINAALERRVLRISRLALIADDLHFITDFFPDGERWRSKVVSVTNGYDEEDFCGTENLNSAAENSFVISYVGGFYDQETFENVVAPLRQWAKQHPEDMSSVRFVYAGGASRMLHAEGALPCTLEDHGFLTHHEAISLRFRSHVQLFGQPSYFKPHVYSGKIFEMIRTPVPILAVTRPDSAPARLVQETRTGVAVAPGDDLAGAVFLKQVFERWKTGGKAPSIDESKIQEYSRGKLALTALRAIDRAIQG